LIEENFIVNTISLIVPQLGVIFINLFVLYLVFYSIFKLVGIDLNHLLKSIMDIFKNVIKATFKIFYFVVVSIFNVFRFFIYGLKPINKGERVRKAEFMSKREERKYLKSSNKGVLVDGDSKRISEDLSYRHLLVVGNSGSGKTSRFIIPNILSRDTDSLVITDLSGDIYRKTAQSLKEKGYEIRIFAPEQLDISNTYNPLLRLRGLSEELQSKEISELAQILMESSSDGNNSGDNFFNLSAQRILNILIYALVQQEEEKYCTFHNLNLLLNRFNSDVKSLDHFILENTLNNRIIYEEYRNLTSSSSSNTLQSILLSAQVSVAKFSNQNLARVTTTSDIDFNEFRDKKVALFIVISEARLSYYAFILNIIYSQLFSFSMSQSELELKNKNGIYLFLDEFGHLAIPDFTAISATIRKYKVSLNLVLQSTKQLNKYGSANAETILNGSINNHLYVSIDFDSANLLNKVLGRQSLQKQLIQGI
jgi:type IV secretion system protein VirD4